MTGRVLPACLCGGLMVGQVVVWYRVLEEEGMGPSGFEMVAKPFGIWHEERRGR